MAFKRPFHEDGDGDDDGLGFLVQEPKRRSTFKKTVLDVMRGSSLDDLVSRMEPFLRKVVREEAERAILTFPKDLNMTPRTSFNQADTSEGRCLKLLFVNKLPGTIFTGGRIEAEDGGAVRIELIDPVSKTRLTYGADSAIKVQILVLDGDFGFEDQENWTEQEFMSKVVRERDGKRPLVTGDLHITFKDGVGIITDISFTDNSSWIKCRKFRLGAKVVQTNPGQVRIMEAKSEAFTVKDHRGELYKKHHPPALNDEIWRLEKIAKDGKYHQKLAYHNIRTVQDFMRSYMINPSSLKEILDCPKRAWDTIVDHASTCVVNDETFYSYAVEGVSLLFNSIYKLVAVTLDGRNYQFLDDLTFNQKPWVESKKKQAYRNLNSFVAVNGHAIFGPSRSLMSLQAGPFSSPTSCLQQHPEFPLGHQGSSEIQSGFDHASPSTSYNYELEDQSQQSRFSVAQYTHPVQSFDPMGRNYSFKLSDLFSPCNEEIVPNLPSEVMCQAPMSTWPHGNGLYFGPTSGDSELSFLSSLPNIGVHISRTGKTKAAWCKIRAAVMWGSVRRELAAKRMTRPFYINSIGFSV